jgi:S-formylglutathione hydrolase FrmB
MLRRRMGRRTGGRAGAWGTVAAMVGALALAVVAPVLAGRDTARPAVTPGALTTLTVTAAPAVAEPTTTATTAAAPTAGGAPKPNPTTTTTARRPAASAKPKRPGPGTVQFFTMASGDGDGRRREFWVYRPGVPESSDLPVVYFLHGYPGNEHTVSESGLAPALEQLFASGVKPFVVVAPDGQSSARRDTEWTDSADGNVKLESYIVNRLVPAVEGAHRRDRAHRAVAGFSMGGFGAMNLGLKHPDLFGQIVSIAGYFRVDDPDGMGQNDPQWLAANSPDQHVPAGAGSRILLVSAAEEHDPLIAGEAQRYRRLAEAAGQHPALVVAPGAHTFDLVVAQAPTVARFLAGGW